LKNRLGSLAQLVTVVLAVAPLCGCGDDSGGGGGAGGAGGSGAGDATVQTYEPGSSPFGKTYGEWAGAWWRYVYETLPDESCFGPTTDPNGASCKLGQDLSSPVFFLAGNAGGTTLRDQCVVPADKALFFPLLSFTTDNGGVPEELQQTDEQMRASAEASNDDIDRDSLTVEVDGATLPSPEAYETGLFAYSYVLPPEPNFYSCGGVPGVTGEVSPAYGNGFFVMLRPLAAGSHRVRFAGRIVLEDGDFVLDVTYELTVE